MKRSLLVQTLLDMATGSGGAKLEELIVNAAGTFDAGSGKGYNPVTVASGAINVLGEKGVVSNNSIVVTPKAQIVGGWLNSGMIDGAGVGVSASELVSGALNVTENGVFDVTNYSEANVAVPENILSVYNGKHVNSTGGSSSDMTIQLPAEITVNQIVNFSLSISGSFPSLGSYGQVLCVFYGGIGSGNNIEYKYVELGRTAGGSLSMGSAGVFLRSGNTIRIESYNTSHRFPNATYLYHLTYK